MCVTASCGEFVKDKVFSTNFAKWECERDNAVRDLILHRKLASCIVEFNDFTDILSYAEDTWDKSCWELGPVRTVILTAKLISQ
jgi:hypothetical protein